MSGVTKRVVFEREGAAFKRRNQPDRFLTAGFIVACIALTLGFVMGERWIFAGGILFAVLPLGCFLIGVSQCLTKSEAAKPGFRSSAAPDKLEG